MRAGCSTPSRTWALAAVARPSDQHEAGVALLQARAVCVRGVDPAASAGDHLVKMPFLVAAVAVGGRSPYLWTEVSPVLPLLAAYTSTLCAIFLLRTALMDPGIVPKGTEGEIKESVERDPGAGHHPPRTMDVQVS